MVVIRTSTRNLPYTKHLKALQRDPQYFTANSLGLYLAWGGTCWAPTQRFMGHSSYVYWAYKCGLLPKKCGLLSGMVACNFGDGR